MVPITTTLIKSAQQAHSKYMLYLQEGQRKKVESEQLSKENLKEKEEHHEEIKHIEKEKMSILEMEKIIPENRKVK